MNQQSHYGMIHGNTASRATTKKGLKWCWNIPTEFHSVFTLNLPELLASVTSIYLTTHKLVTGTNLLDFKDSYIDLGWMYRDLFIILLLLDRPPCPGGMIIVGWWWSSTQTEAKETLGYVPIELRFFSRPVIIATLLSPIWPPPPRLSSTNRVTVREWYPRLRGDLADRVGGGQPCISWSLSETGGQWRLTAADGEGIPSTERNRRGGKRRGEHKRRGPGEVGGSGRFGWKELRIVERRRDWRAAAGRGGGGSYGGE